MRLPHPPPTTMGCGISRINLMEEGMACGLKRRIVESRSKNDLLAKSDPSSASTKFLLKEDNAKGHGIPRHHVPNDDDDDDDDGMVVMKEPPLKQQIREREKEKGDRLRNCDQSPMKKKLGEHKERGPEKEKKYETDTEDGAEEDDDDGRRISNVDGNWIGSPSFREYCVDSESEDGDRFSGVKTEKKTRGMDNVACTGEVCVHPGAKTLEKESRGRKFIKAFPMHRPKNFWNVTTCYSRNNHHVPSGKPPHEKEV